MRDTRPRGFVPMSKGQREQVKKDKIRRLTNQVEAIEKEIQALKK